ncbi:mechanosensitive ion channel domain-containing protein [Accumulibacter sp.]|uniref:mechanosensitive ion channel domain-containing protein n=1 Tax=Accumulibacter sp. TaxID=2053492 RepID=UPI0025F7F8C6|nr:mechanosensitive ion channel domain-containing protein [Accumulibacter sp.]MCP5228860.1 mechanosensitive ion channel [Accumulibacter sp.]
MKRKLPAPGCHAVRCGSAMNGRRLIAILMAVLVALVVTLPLRAEVAPQADLAHGIAAENARLTARIAATRSAIDQARSDLEQSRGSQRQLDRRLQRIERHAQVHALGQVFAQTVIEQLSELPGSESFDADQRARESRLEAASDASLRTERALDELTDMETELVLRFGAVTPALPDALWPQFEAAARPLLGEQQVLLASLDELQGQLLQALQASDAAALELAQRTQAARTELTRLLFWVPAQPSLQTISELSRSWAWMTSAANWRAAAVALAGQLAWRPFWPTLTLLLAGALFLARKRLQGKLVVLAPGTANSERYWIGYTVTALVITMALALPGPLVLWTAAKLLAAAPDAQRFALALAAALMVSAKLLLALSAFAWLLDRRGVAGGHFGWDESLLSFSGHALRRFCLIFVPLLFVVALNGLDHAPYANRESIGRMSLTLAMLVVAIFVIRMLRRQSPLSQRLRERAPRSWAVRLHALWFGTAVAVPLAIAALSAAGYFVAAGYFFAHTLMSLFLVLGAVALYGLIALWVQLERRRLRRHQALEALRQARAAAAEGDEEASEVAEPAPPRLDIAAISEQTRSLLDLFITLLLLGGIWWVWKDGLPALSVITDFPLWTYHSTVDGKNITLPLTVGKLFLAVVVGVVTAVAVRNVGALLDIVLLQRFEVQADATYAIKVVTRYALAAVGMVSACSILGIAWGDVHWLIAAMGVGLGFGLQEIVANFVSGLIVLAERPIRIGDIVTVGDVTGTVARIRARATAVLDFDGKEVIIPNKAFITGSVVNWTLSNQNTRLLLKVGVAYGSEIALVQRVLLEVVQGNADVLQDPSPSVYFMDFGDSSLDFEVRAFVGSFDKRLRVTHELNLAIEAVLGEHGIEIPFPQRDLHVRSAPALAGMQDGVRQYEVAVPPGSPQTAPATSPSSS